MPTRIMIADDEVIQRMDLKDMLTSLGYLVVGEAGDGLSALNLAREIRPDLVIMDIRMPGMDGIAAAHTLTREKIAPVLLQIQKASMDNRKSMRNVAEAILLAYEM